MQRIKRNPELAWRQIGSQVMILKPDQDRHLFELNETASWIWLELDGSKSLQDIQEKIQDTYEVGAQAAQDDLKSILKNFQSNELILHE